MWGKMSRRGRRRSKKASCARSWPKMILVLASAADSEARAFAEEIGGAVLTCCALAENPLAVRYPDFRVSSFATDRLRLGPGGITAVVNLLLAVLPDEMF